MRTKFRAAGWQFWTGAVIGLSVAGLTLAALMNASFRTLLAEMGASVPALGVLAAALIAYDGALAKTRLDLHLAEEARNRQRLRYLLKAEYAIADCLNLYRMIQTRQLFEPLDRDGNPISSPEWENPLPTTPTGEGFRAIVEDPPALAEILDNLDFLQPSTIGCLRKLNYILRRMKLYLHARDMGQSYAAGRHNMVRGDPQFTSIVSDAVSECILILEDLKAEVDKLAPYLPEEIRNRRLHGEN